jgi:predicted NUDIX family phosphoesterase
MLIYVQKRKKRILRIGLYMPTSQTQTGGQQTGLVVSEERILVVPSGVLFPHGSWQGLKQTNDPRVIQTILEKKIFMPRGEAEHNPIYKQIIPYLVFTYQGLIFLMQRSAKSHEERLHNMFSFGIGGHIREEDMVGENIIDWARREFHEEIAYTDTCTFEHIGILNDDSNDVGRVHAGWIYLLRGSSPHITIKSEFASGRLVSLKECQGYYPYLEPWSQVVFDYLWSQEAQNWEDYDQSIDFTISKFLWLNTTLRQWSCVRHNS